MPRTRRQHRTRQVADALESIGDHCWIHKVFNHPCRLSAFSRRIDKGVCRIEVCFCGLEMGLACDTVFVSRGHEWADRQLRQSHCGDECCFGQRIDWRDPSEKDQRDDHPGRLETAPCQTGTAVECSGPGGCQRKQSYDTICQI